MKFEIKDGVLLKCLESTGSDTIVVPDNVSEIKEWAFSQCKKVREILIPAGVNRIDEEWFGDLSIYSYELTRITVDANNQFYKDIDGVLFSKDGSVLMTVPFRYPKKSYQVPNGVTRVACCAFANNKTLDGKVILPDSVMHIGPNAFSGCSGLRRIRLPKYLDEIPYSCFYECDRLTQIDIPESVTAIRESAFLFCGLKEITLSKNIKELESCWVSDTLETIRVESENLYFKSVDGILYTKDGRQLTLFPPASAYTEFSVPEGCEEIEMNAFHDNENLRSIVMPSTMSIIGVPETSRIKSGAITITILNHSLGQCAYLKTIRFKGEIQKIYEYSLPDNKNLEIIFDKFFLKNSMIPLEDLMIPEKARIIYSSEDKRILQRSLATSGKISNVWCKHIKDANAFECAYVLIYQTTKGWADWLKSYSGIFDKILIEVIKVLNEEAKIPAPVAKRVLDFTFANLTLLNRELILRIIDFMKSKNVQKPLKDFEDKAEVVKLLGTKSTNPIEEYVKTRLSSSKKSQNAEEIEKQIQKGIRYSDDSGFCTADVIRFVIERYAQLPSVDADLNMQRFGYNYRVTDEEADHVALALNKQQLIKTLRKPIHGREYKAFIKAYARFSNDDDIQLLIREIQSEYKSKAWKKAAVSALYHSDTAAAREYISNKGNITIYAKMRNKSEEEVRNENGLPLFDLNSNGVRIFDIKEGAIEVSIDENLDFIILDTAKKKTLRSFPKQSMDEKILKKQAANYEMWKKEVSEFIKQRIASINRFYLDNQSISSELWKSVYLMHPILKTLVKHLLWEDSSETQFMITDSGIMNVKKEAYIPDGEIRLGHILDMSTASVQAWRDYLSAGKHKQLFAQLWEPIVLSDTRGKIDINRYRDAKLTPQERNTFKKRMSARGIEVHAAERNYEYDHGSYMFDRKGTMVIGSYVTLDYENDAKGNLILKSLQIMDRHSDRAVNSVIFELDRACLMHRISVDFDEILTDDMLDSLNLAQINELINHAIRNKSVKCTTILMNHKNLRFAHYPWLDELTLDI